MSPFVRLTSAILWLLAVERKQDTHPGYVCYDPFVVIHEQTVHPDMCKGTIAKDDLYNKQFQQTLKKKMLPSF